GCPVDSDGDGVPDGVDQCSDTPKGLKGDAKGRPIEGTGRKTERSAPGIIRLQNVNFEPNKPHILPDSYPTLDAVGMLLTRWPQLKLELGGDRVARCSAGEDLRVSAGRGDT